MGKQYENDIFVGDFNNGNIYRFKLNQERTGLSLEGPLADKIANNIYEREQAVFAHGFGGDHRFTGRPDGYLYILSNGEKNIQIVPIGH